MSVRRVKLVLGWIGVEHSHVVIWKWVQKFGYQLTEDDRQRAANLLAILLLDETVIKQRGEEFILFAAVAPETRHLLHAAVVHSRNYLPTWRFIEELRELYGRVPLTVVTDGATYGPLRPIRHHTDYPSHSVRNRIERWIQELKRRIDTFYISSLDTASTPRRISCVNSLGYGMRA